MGITKTFTLESMDAAGFAHHEFRKRHRYLADTANPKHLAELIRYAQESMSAKGWGDPEEQGEQLVRDLEIKVLDWEDPDEFERRVSLGDF